MADTRDPSATTTHFEKANTYTVKIRSRTEYPFANDEKGAFSGAGFLVDKNLGWIDVKEHPLSKKISDYREHAIYCLSTESSYWFAAR